ncbi:MAG: AAA family ATPase [Gammaproteobacteria bacterium]|nr:AAA family ATPase [Gammaproteobacteria bacterium]
MAREALPAQALYTPCDPRQFSFETTAELEELSQIIGQARAQQAVDFGVSIQRDGYNLYAMGPSGMGKHAMVRGVLEERSATRPTPPDWVYVNNFEQNHRPLALRLPPGQGNVLARDMAHLVEDLSTAIPSAFESDEYRASAQAIDEEFRERQTHAFDELATQAATRNVKLFRTPSGFAFAPMQEGKVLGPEEFEHLDKREQERIEKIVAELQAQLQVVIQQIPQWRKDSREKLKKLNNDVTLAAVGHFIDDLKVKYQQLPEVLKYLDDVSKDVVEKVDDFRKEDGAENPMGGPAPKPTELHRYKVNVLVDNGATQGAPVIYLDHPTYQDLVGRAEHLAQFGTLVTDFTLLKPGALHRANGGYLMLDAHKLLSHPFAWEGLKRALYANRINIESLEKMLSLVTSVSLEPTPIPLDIKVVLLGDRLLYYLLYQYDPDFGELFKVQADFEERITRNSDNDQTYARLIATLAKKDKLRPFDRYAVARVIEYGARMIEDAQKVSTHMRSIADLLCEADYWACAHQSPVITVEDVQHAIDQQIYRASRVREQLQEEVQRGTLLIDTTRAVIGQVNGLSVLSMGNFSFGEPARITATVHLGEGNVVDIEREVELGGAVHSKGVMILGSFLAARYAQHHPLSLTASLVFEQSYGRVDGDSASMAELCALMSALSGIPIRQSLAITGSVNQNGESQPIGGVNEKIEGFFDVCRARGLDGSHGVLIPVSNVKHLMLRHDVVEAAEKGLFHVYDYENVDQAFELLTGIAGGTADSEGNFPPDSANGRVQARLVKMAEIRASFGDRHKHSDGSDDEHTESPHP